MQFSRSALLIGLLALGGCATQEGSVPNLSSVLLDTSGQNGRACVQQRDIRGYGVLDGDVISIDARRGYYLATTLPGCNNLGTAPRAAFEERFSEVCGGGMHKLYTGDDQCTIRHMFEFEDRQSAFKAHQKAIEHRQQLREAKADAKE